MYNIRVGLYFPTGPFISIFVEMWRKQNLSSITYKAQLRSASYPQATTVFGTSDANDLDHTLFEQCVLTYTIT